MATRMKVRSIPEDSHYSKVVVNGETIMDLTGDTVSANKLLSGFTAHDKTGAPIEGTCTFDANTSDANAAAAEILSGKTAYVKGSKVTGTMPSKGGVTGTITDLDAPYTIPQGYHDGSGSVSIDTTESEKIIPSNIREGVTILGVEGTMSGAEDVKAQAKTVIPTFSQQEILPDSGSGYNYLSSVTVKAIPVSEFQNEQDGYTLTIGGE